uniref:Small ribosomal subunit protein uS3c n=1 Tax=Medicago suffruticosa TaxID=66818 RepID=A0A4P8F1C1_9FABA|nr:ribosomal protein S3 [Medicago suffruticosa]QCO73278.1 ribosomal protein S3 [Medicago suffruticosa]
MGQKIHPLGFRLGTTQSHDSIWFAQPRNYSENLKEDKIIRGWIKNYIQKTSGVEGIGRIKIKKRIDRIQVIIYIGLLTEDKFEELQKRIKELQTNVQKKLNMGLPTEDKPLRIEELQTNVQKKVNCVTRKINITITRILNGYSDPTILAKFIAGQLTNRISFRKATKKAIELAQQAGTKGVQVQIAGRIDGKEIARVEWIREGRVPLQTIRAKIDYGSYTVRTIFGVLGIKVWIFLNND